MPHKKVKIIPLEIDLNIEDEINKKVEALKSDIVVHTKGFIERAKLKKQKSNKKTKMEQLKNERIGKAMEKLIEAFNEARIDEEYWVEGNKLLTAADMDPTPQNLSKFSLHMRKHLENSEEWVLSKKRKSRRTYYRLSKRTTS